MVEKAARQASKEAKEAKEAKEGCLLEKEGGHGTKEAKVARMAKAVVEGMKEKAKAQARGCGTTSRPVLDTRAFVGNAGKLGIKRTSAKW